jgi:cation:H+ antiporter
VLSEFFRISQVAIGCLLIAIATSLPELSVSVVSSTLGEGALAAGNVFGSNIANVLLVLGLGAFFFGLRINRSSLRDIGLILLLTTIISVYIVFNSSLGRAALGFWEGAVLLGIFLVYGWRMARTRKMNDSENRREVTKHEALKAFLLFGVGIVVVMISSGFVVESAVDLARLAGVAESFIGATVIAIGTSLPELSVDIQAIRKRRFGLALGDAIGSNMINITLVLGTAAVINPIMVSIPVFIAALLFAVVANMALMYAGAVDRGISRPGGAMFLLLYVVYVVAIFGLQIRELGTG